MQLLNGVVTKLESGNYVFNAVIGTGTAALEISLEGEAFTVLENSSLSASGNGFMQLPICSIRATLTGDALMYLKLQDNRPIGF